MDSSRSAVAVDAVALDMNLRSWVVQRHTAVERYLVTWHSLGCTRCRRSPDCTFPVVHCDPEDLSGQHCQPGTWAGYRQASAFRSRLGNNSSWRQSAVGEPPTPHFDGGRGSPKRKSPRRRPVDPWCMPI